MTAAVFLDRDGVINELVYHQERGIIDSPFTPAQFRLMPGVTSAMKLLHKAGYLIMLVSNQPGIAKGHMSSLNFEMIRQKMIDVLGGAGTYLDGEYYCLHHPDAIVQSLKSRCNCRKPEPGLLIEAAREKNLDLQRSWMIGDNISDIEAGEKAGCHTILLGNVKCELCHLMAEKGIRPDKISRNLEEAARELIFNGECLGEEPCLQPPTVSLKQKQYSSK